MSFLWFCGFPNSEYFSDENNHFMQRKTLSNKTEMLTKDDKNDKR